MPDLIKYRSVAVNLFKIWKLVYLGIPAIIAILFFNGHSLNTSVFWSLLIVLIFAFLLVVLSSSTIIKEGRNVTLMNVKRSILIEQLESIETWWSYKFSSGSREYSGDGASGKTRGHINAIFVYAELKGASSSAVIFEEIYMSDKFPNNHPFNNQKKVDKKRLVKVWDVDRCLEKLTLAHL